MVNIRRAEVDDIEHFKEVVESSITVLCKDHYSQDQINGLLKQYPVPELYKRWLNERILLVAEKDSKIVGFAQFDPAIAAIEAVHVLPECTHLGIGRRLVEEIENIASAMNIKRIVLESSINADKFYAKCGYVRKGLAKFTCNNGVELKTVTYEKQLHANNSHTIDS